MPGQKGGCVSIRVYYDIDANESEAAIQAANDVMSKYLLVRPVVSQTRDSIVFCIDSFCPDGNVFRRMFPESIALLGEAIEYHYSAMQKILSSDTSVLSIMEYFKLNG